MIGETEYFHGAAIYRLLRATDKAISVAYCEPPGAYLLDNSVCLYLKYSTSRMSPWSFTFSAQHIADLQKLRAEFPHTVVGLVCNDDGIVGLTVSEVDVLVGQKQASQASISVGRRKREKYSIKGTVASLSYKVGQEDFAAKVFGLWEGPEAAIDLPWVY